MNDFERMNLQRLRDEGIDLSAFEQPILDEFRAESHRTASAIVYALFDKYQGDAGKVKADLREDAELYEKLNLTETINDVYQYIQAKRNRLQVTRWSDNRTAREKRPWLFADPA